MKENIEEYIITLEQYLNAIDTFGTIDYKCINNLYDPVKSILSDYKKVLKENEELKEAVEIYKGQVETKIDAYIDSNYISKQKIKEKIDKLEREFDFYAGREHSEWQDGEFDGDACDDLNMQIKALKELLKEEK